MPGSTVKLKAVKRMETNEFLHNVYGSLRDGYLSVTILENGKSRTRWFDTGHLDEMAAYAVEAGKTCNTYFGVNPRTTALGEFRRGDREDISAVIGTYTDFDIKGDAHKEKNLPETKEVLMGFLMALPIQPTIIIESGNGIHAYWLFKEIFYIGNESDRDYIEKIVKGWESFVKDKAFHERGWKFDSVSDLPRMLRAIGTVNHKTVERPISIVASFTEDRYSPSDFEGYASAQPAKKSAGTTETDGFALMGTGSGRELIDKCVFLKHCRDDAESLPEPEWYAAITNLAQTADGESIVHEISSPYPGYTREETQRKYVHAAQENKPVTCEYINSYTGNLILQKTYRENYLTKRTLKNDGVLPKYHAQGTHEPIIDIDTWNAVQEEFTRRAEKHDHRGVKQKSYPFTGIITCGCCGKHYHRKVTHAGVVWICDTYNHFGKDACPSKAVPEPVLERLAGDIAPSEITAVRAENGNRLVITTPDGSEIVKRWQDRSRAESWTPEMKEAARQKALARSKA